MMISGWGDPAAEKKRNNKRAVGVDSDEGKSFVSLVSPNFKKGGLWPRQIVLLKLQRIRWGRLALSERDWFRDRVSRKKLSGSLAGENGL